MKQLVVLSGKGGAGKTTITGALLRLAGENKAFADCDVDAPNLYIICNNPEQVERKDYYGAEKAVKHEDKCINCGVCNELCRFDAIKNNSISTMECEGCGVCSYFCPAGAITMEQNISGETNISIVSNEIFSHAELLIGNGASGKLVTEVRKNLYDRINGEQLIILDGSPGIGCPVIASITGTSNVLAVAEPTLSGLHDLRRVIDTAKRFGVQCAVCINKYDVNLNVVKKIEEYCKTENIPVVGRIPYDKKVVEAVNNKQSVMDYPQSAAAQAISQMWNCLKKVLNSREENE